MIPAPQPRRRAASGAPAATPPGQAPAAPAPSGSELRFKGQQPGENVVFIERPHWIYVVVQAIPALALLVVLVVLTIVRLFSTLGLLLGIAQVLVGLALLAATVYWLWAGLIRWITHVYILTDWRIILKRGFFHRVREQATLDRIQQMTVVRRNLFAALFDLGDVQLVTAGSSTNFRLLGVRDPRALIRTVSVTQIVGRGAAPADIVMRNPTFTPVLDELDNLDEVPPTSLAKAENRAVDSAGFEVPVALFDGEQVLELITRHWFNLLLRCTGAILVGLGGTAVGILALVLGPPIVGRWPVILIAASLIVGAIWALGVYSNYADDVLVLTTHRVIDLDRLFYVFNETRKEATLRRIQDVRVDVPFLGLLLGYGKITIETASQSDPLEMTYVPKPRDVQDRIYAYVVAAEERSEATQRRRRRKREFKRWMGTVLNEMVVTVPDVRGAGLLEAAERARRAGMRLVVDSERPTSGLRPGLVLDQVPHAATTAMRGNELRIILSSAAAGVP